MGTLQNRSGFALGKAGHGRCVQRKSISRKQAFGLLRQNIWDNDSFPEPFRCLAKGYIRKAFHENGRLFCVILMI